MMDGRPRGKIPLPCAHGIFTASHTAAVLLYYYYVVCGVVLLCGGVVCAAVCVVLCCVVLLCGADEVELKESRVKPVTTGRTFNEKL